MPNPVVGAKVSGPPFRLGEAAGRNCPNRHAGDEIEMADQQFLHAAHHNERT